MKSSIHLKNPELILSHGSYGFEEVINDFKNAIQIYIITYNFYDAYGIVKNSLNTLRQNTNVIIITNFPSYWNLTNGTHQQKLKSISQLEELYAKLDFDKYQCNLNPYINHTNHAKIISTENICYVGSANYSSASCNNYECGILIKDKVEIKNIFNLISQIKKDSTKMFGNSSLMKIDTIIQDLKNSIPEINSIIKFLNTKLSCSYINILLPPEAVFSLLYTNDDIINIYTFKETLKDTINLLKSKDILDNIGNEIDESLVDFIDIECELLKNLHVHNLTDYISVEMLVEDFIDDLKTLQNKINIILSYLSNTKSQYMNI